MTNTTTTKYPEIEVSLIGQDGNAFGILGAVERALKDAGVSRDEISDYMNEAMAGDYDELLRTTMRWVSIV